MSEPARRGPNRQNVLHATTRGDEVALQLDGAVLAREQVIRSEDELERTAEAANIVEAARARSEELLRDAASHLGDLERAGHRAGFEAGYAEGLQQAGAELAGALALVQTAALEGKTVRDQIVEGAEREVIALVIAALERVVGIRAGQDEQLVLESVRRGLERVGAQQVVRLRVNPGDADTLRVWLDERGREGAHWELRPDGSVDVGGCVIDTTAGEVDARLDVQLAQIAEQLRNAVPHAD